MGDEPIGQQYKMTNLGHYSKDIEMIYNFMDWKIKIQRYCEADCISLYQVLMKFRDQVFWKFGVDSNLYPTTPSLSFAIYRTHYMPDNCIPILKGEIHDFYQFLKIYYYPPIA